MFTFHPFAMPEEEHLYQDQGHSSDRPKPNQHELDRFHDDGGPVIEED